MRVFYITVLRRFCVLSMAVVAFTWGAGASFAQTKKVSWTEEPGSKLTPALLFDTSLWTEKKLLQDSLAHSLQYLRAEKSNSDYKKLANEEITHDRVLRSVERFSELLESSNSYDELAVSLSEEFLLVKPQQGTSFQPVKFTGYFQPTYEASLTKQGRFIYPIYAEPPDFSTWPKPHPKRVYLEGYSGLGNPHSPLKGKELAYLGSRWEAFMIHVQGSAVLRLADGGEMAVGFSSATDYPFRGVSRAFLEQYKVAWHKLGSFFQKNPALLDDILSRNNRYIFFKANPHPLPIGSLGVPVVAERSIATDKSLMPPGALSVVHARLPYLQANGNIQMRPGLRFVLDQDTGSAIKGSARVDIFMGTGPEAQKKANAVYSLGDLYYLLLKDS